MYIPTSEIYRTKKSKKKKKNQINNIKLCFSG
jgi:hypothetical protein